MVGLFLLLVIGLAFGEVPESMQDLQTEFYLPYSVTEDVDFSIARPGGFGCYQWSTDNQDAVVLSPVYTDFEQMCGNKLELQIPKNSGNEQISFIITAENVDLNTGYDNQDVPPMIEYTIHIRLLGKLEVLGLKTELKAGGDPVPFGVAGYDAEDNEFDTLDGLQISWYIGSKRDIAMFEAHRQMGPIVKVLPLGTGKGAVIAVLSDSNYDKLEPAFLEFSVSANLMIEPDGVFLLEGAKVPMKLMEQTGLKDAEGKPIIKEIPTVAEDADFRFEIKEAEFVTLDKSTSVLTGMAVGETTLFVKNSEGEIVKGMPVRVTKAHSVKVTAEPNPESKQLIKDHEYEIKVNLLNKEERPIYPSENILCKTTFPKQFELLEVAENGLSAKIKAINQGLGKVKANLRSVLTPDDEELEIVPHVKGSTDFEVYEKVTIKPKETILPWDENVKPTYDMTFEAEGGGKVYSYSVDNPEAATVDTEGHVTTTLSGPASFKVKAFMVKSDSNFDESQVHILPATHLEITNNMAEFAMYGSARIPLAFSTMLPETNEKVMFSDCSDIPYEVQLSDEENFEIVSKSTRGQTQSYNYCATFEVRAKKAGPACKVSVSYVEPSSGRTLRDHHTISAYDPLDVAYPKRDNKLVPIVLRLPVGSTSKLVFTGGPLPWAGKPSAHMKQIEVDDSTIAKVSHEGKTQHEDGSYKFDHIYEVTCLKQGQTEVTFLIGNSKTAVNMDTATEVRVVSVECSMPAKLAFHYQAVDQGAAKMAHNSATNRVLSNKKNDLHLTYTVKDKDGKTFHNVDSLDIQVKVSDPSVLAVQSEKVTIPSVKAENGQFAIVPGKAHHILKAQGKEGPVDVHVKIAGYNKDVLAKAGVVDPPPLPKVADDDEEEDFEDEEEFEQHGHALKDSVELHLTTEEEIEKIIRK